MDKRKDVITGDVTAGNSEKAEGQVISTTITPHIMEHGKFFRGNAASEFYELKYSQGMNVDSKKYRDQLPVSLNNTPDTVTFGYWSFGQQSVGFVQMENLAENKFGGSGTNRPFVQKRIGLVDPTILAGVYSKGIRPLASALVNAYPNEKAYLLKRYESVEGLTDESWTLETNVEDAWQIHQDETYKRLAIRTAEAVLAKRQVKIGNPVALEHAGELTPQLLPNFIDTVNVLALAINPQITTISAISAASMQDYSNVDLVIKNVSIPQTTAIYPSYIVNRVGKEQEVLPGHYSTPAFKTSSEVMTMYETLHRSAQDWVKNHESVLKRS